MAQQSENFAFPGNYDFIIPVASTAIAAGDALMELNGACKPMTADRDGYDKFVGFSDDDWSSTIAINLYGSSSGDYATPTTRPHKIKVFKSGVFKLAIRDTSGTKGQAVYLVTATSGGQVFTIDPADENVGGPVGYLWETFSGASANDVQKVRVLPRESLASPDIRHYLMNHILFVNPMTITNIACSAPSDSAAITIKNFFAIVGGKFISVPSITCGTVTNSLVDGHQLIIYALGTDGSISAYLDSAKATQTGTATMRINSFYWPSVTLDLLPIALGIRGSQRTYVTGVVNWIQRSIADCLKVT